MWGGDSLPAQSGLIILEHVQRKKSTSNFLNQVVL